VTSFSKAGARVPGLGLSIDSLADNGGVGVVEDVDRLSIWPRLEQAYTAF
jgi:hypothetical protein